MSESRSSTGVLRSRDISDSIGGCGGLDISACDSRAGEIFSLTRLSLRWKYPSNTHLAQRRQQGSVTQVQVLSLWRGLESRHRYQTTTDGECQSGSSWLAGIGLVSRCRVHLGSHVWPSDISLPPSVSLRPNRYWVVVGVTI